MMPYPLHLTFNPLNDPPCDSFDIETLCGVKPYRVQTAAEFEDAVGQGNAAPDICPTCVKEFVEHCRKFPAAPPEPERSRKMTSWPEFSNEPTVWDISIYAMYHTAMAWLEVWYIQPTPIDRRHLTRRAVRDRVRDIERAADTHLWGNIRPFSRPIDGAGIEIQCRDCGAERVLSWQGDERQENEVPVDLRYRHDWHWNWSKETLPPVCPAWRERMEEKGYSLIFPGQDLD